MDQQATFPFPFAPAALRPDRPDLAGELPRAGDDGAPAARLAGASASARAGTSVAGPSGASVAGRTGVSAADVLSDPAEAIGFDHARYGLVPPAACLWPGHPVREGWERGRRLLGRRTRPATLAVRRWLALRLQAWRAGEPFDDHAITPQLLRSLEVATHCPVSGRRLDERACVVPADGARGWVGGNLVLLSPELAPTWCALSLAQAGAALARAEAEPDLQVDGLSLRQWRRMVSLKSLATPLPHAAAARLPLCVLPPSRLHLVNPIQELQALLTLQLAAPGWGQRARAIGQSLPQTLRADFNLFFNSLLAQALREAHGPLHAPMRAALAAAWSDPVVQRRWARLVGGIDAALARTLAERLAREPMPGLVVVRHAEPGACTGA